MSFICMGAMKWSNENSVGVGIFSFCNPPPPQFEPLIFVPGYRVFKTRYLLEDSKIHP